MGPNIKAVLLAAGAGTRLRPLTDALPKCLMPIMGRPLLGYWLGMLTRAGIDDIVVNLHHHAEIVREYVQRSPYANAVTLSFEDELLGTGGTILRHRERFGAAPVLVAHADNLALFSVERFIAAHHARPEGSALTMMTFVTDVPQQCGIVELDAGNMVVGFHEKSPNPPGDLANAAVYIIEPEVMAFICGLGRRFVDFSTDVLPHFVGRMSTFHNDVYLRDIGTFANLARAQLEFPMVLARYVEAWDGRDPWFGVLSGENVHIAREFAKNVDNIVSSMSKGGS